MDNNNFQDPNNNFQDPNLGYQPNNGGMTNPYQDQSGVNQYQGNQYQNPYQDQNTGNQYQPNQYQNPYQDQNTGNQYQNPYQDQNAGNQYQNPYQDQNAGNQYQNPYQDQNAGNQYQNPYQDQNAGNQYQNPYQDQNAGNQYQNPYQDQNAGNQYQPNQYHMSEGANTANNFEQNSYQFNQPKNSYNPIPEEPKKKKGMSKKAKIAIFSSIAAVVVLAVVAVVLLLTVFSPKKSLRKAFEKTIDPDTIMSSSAFENEFGLSSIYKDMEEKGGKVSLGITVGDIAGQDLYDTGFNMTAIMDKKNKKLSGDFEIVSNKESIGDVEFISDADNTYITLKDVVNGYIGFANENFIESYNNSYFVKNGLSTPIEGIDGLNLDIFENANVSSNEVTEKINKMTDQVWDKSKVSYKGSKTIELGENKRKCKKYIVTVPEKVIEDLCDDFFNEYSNLMKSDAFKAAMANSGASEAEIDEIFNQAKDAVKALITDDLEVEVYTYKGIIAAYIIDGNMKVMDQSIKYNLEIKNTGNDNILSSKEISFKLSAAGQTVTGLIKFGSNKKGSSIVTEYSASADVLGESYSAKYEQTYDTKAKTISGTGKIEAAGEELASLMVSGSIESEKKKSVEYKLDSIKFDAGGKTAEFAANFGMAVLSSDVQPAELPSGANVLNIFDASDKDIEKFVEDNASSIEKWITKISKNPLFSEGISGFGNIGGGDDFFGGDDGIGGDGLGGDDGNGGDGLGGDDGNGGSDGGNFGFDDNKDSFYADDIKKADIVVKPGETLDTGTFTLKVDVKETPDRYEYSDDEGIAAVYIATYTVENKSYKNYDGSSDEVNIYLSEYNYVDPKNKAGEYYYLPDVETDYSVAVKTGEKKTFTVVFAVKNAGNGCFVIPMDIGNGEYKTVVIEVEPKK